jgi:hypothetical protein
MTTPALTDTDRQVLELAIREDLSPGRMENAIHELGLRLGMSRTEYDIALLRILRSPAAAAAYPVQVRLLNAARATRVRRRGWR